MKPYSYKLKVHTKPVKLKAEKFNVEIHGTHLFLPTNEIFATEDGTVFVVDKRRGRRAEYTKLSVWVAGQLKQLDHYWQNFSKE